VPDHSSREVVFPNIQPEYSLAQLEAWEFQAGYKEAFLCRKSDDVLQQALKEVVESPSLEVFKKLVDVALRNMV